MKERRLTLFSGVTRAKWRSCRHHQQLSPSDPWNRHKDTRINRLEKGKNRVSTDDVLRLIHVNKGEIPPAPVVCVYTAPKKGSYIIA